MQWIVVLVGITLALPVFKLIINSVRGLHVEPGAYYDFAPRFADAKPWTVALYIGVIAILTFAVFAISGIGFLQFSA